MEMVKTIRMFRIFSDLDQIGLALTDEEMKQIEKIMSKAKKRMAKECLDECTKDLDSVEKKAFKEHYFTARNSIKELRESSKFFKVND